MTEIRVLDHGFVRLDGSMADDLSVVNAARVSFGRYKEEMEESDVGLIRFLMREKHGTPFEHNSMRFHVKAPIFVTREWQRHRVASYNEFSMRYAKLENPDFYMPDEFRQPTEGSKPGQYQYEKWRGNQQRTKEMLKNHYQDSIDIYNWAVENNMAREQARLALPVAIYTEFYFTVNARSLMNFLSLRNEPQAQFEIREYARTLEEIWAGLMPITHETFVNNNRTAP
jgi:thymidylate synthase (FAD)